jgi:hypothetical protein
VGIFSLYREGAPLVELEDVFHSEIIAIIAGENAFT